MRSKFIFTLAVIAMFSVHFASAQKATRDLQENVFFIVECKIKPGQFDNFLKVAAQMSEVVKDKEPGALNYEWTVSPDSTMCYILERYASNEAAMAHDKVFNEEFADNFNKVVEVTGFTLYGNPGPDLLEALGVGSGTTRVQVAGFAR